MEVVASVMDTLYTKLSMAESALQVERIDFEIQY